MGVVTNENINFNPKLYLLLVSLALLQVSFALASTQSLPESDSDELVELTWVYNGIRSVIGTAGFEAANRESSPPHHTSWSSMPRVSS